MIDEIQLEKLQSVAGKIRKHIVEMTHAAKSGHPGGSMSMADIITHLYFKWMNIDSKQPKKEDRDIFVLCKGHAAPALYSAMAVRGFFPEEELKTLRQVGSRLQGHPDKNAIPGIEMSTGSLGQGLSASVGMSLALKLDKKPNRVYAVLGDGELQEGQVWEAAMSAAHYKCDNLCAFIDNNKLQIDGAIEDIMGIDPIADKFRAFGWEVFEIDGHCFQDIDDALVKADSIKGKPVAIVADTVKGKGVSFMEGQLCFHGAPCNDDQKVEACSELDKINGVCGC